MGMNGAANSGKAARRIFHSTSGDTVSLRERMVIKKFLEGNAAYPAEKFSGRKRPRPQKNHAVISYYAGLMNSKPPANASERVYGAPPPATYRVRPVKLLREGKGYHAVERVHGPNLLDFIHFAEERKGPSLKRGPFVEEERLADNEMRRKALADFVRAHRKEVVAWKPLNREFTRELYGQMQYIRDAHEGMLDTYGHEMKETDFIVEGIERGKDGKLRLQLVLVDFK